MKYIGILISVILLFSCNDVQNKDYCKSKLEDALKVKVSDDFSLIEYNSDFAIGDYGERFKIKLSNNEFKKLYSSIDSTKLEKANNMNLYYLNICEKEGELISIIFDPKEYSIQYNVHSE